MPKPASREGAPRRPGLPVRDAPDLRDRELAGPGNQPGRHAGSPGRRPMGREAGAGLHRHRRRRIHYRPAARALEQPCRAHRRREPSTRNLQQRVDQVVDALLAKGVYVILDMHHYSQLSGDRAAPERIRRGSCRAGDPAGEHVAPDRAALQGPFAQAAVRTAQRAAPAAWMAKPWNELAAEGVGRGARQQSHSRRAHRAGRMERRARRCPSCSLPPDRNLIVAIHNYDPFPFTHQGVDAPGQAVSRRCHLLRCRAAQDA